MEIDLARIKKTLEINKYIWSQNYIRYGIVSISEWNFFLVRILISMVRYDLILNIYSTISTIWVKLIEAVNCHGFSCAIIYQVSRIVAFQ